MKAKNALANFREEIEKQSKMVDGKLQLPTLERDESSAQVLENLEWMEQFVQRRKTLAAKRSRETNDGEEEEEEGEDEGGVIAVKARIEIDD
jgi:hypothetical protein